MDEYFVEPLIIDTDNMNPPGPANGMWENRKNSYYLYDMPGVPKCTIYILGYNRLHKTKYCVECVLKYTKDVDYELILVDNGSSDGTYEYFQSVPYEKKKIVRVSKNIGSGFPAKYVFGMARGKYIIALPNDVYVTSNWLSNLLKCYESDPSIGFVLPLSSNVSNLQELNFRYKNFEEMQEKAAEYNKSDPSKWDERMRLISLVNIFSREVMDIVGIFDSAYPHDFGEDDYAVRLRRNGFKLVLCRDTWVCHDHDFRNMEDKDPVAFQKSLENGRAIYKEKYYGIDAWDDINNFELNLLTPLDKAELPGGKLISLVIDGRCGTPVLEIRNRLRRRRMTNVKSYAFTTNAKYYRDLQTVADDVSCDRIDFIQASYVDGFFDIVALCEPLNVYPSPVTLLQRLYNFLKPRGILLFKLRNTDDYNSLLRTAGIGGKTDEDLPAAMFANDVRECLKLFGAKDIEVSSEAENFSEANRNHLLKLVRGIKSDANFNDVARLTTKNYMFKAVKG